MSTLGLSQLFHRCTQAINGATILAVEDGLFNTSTPLEVTGNVTETLILGEADKEIVIKGMLISGEGNVGEAKIVAGGNTLLPLYFSNATHITASNALHLVIPPATDVELITTDRGGNESFAGVTWYKRDV